MKPFFILTNPTPSRYWDSITGPRYFDGKIYVVTHQVKQILVNCTGQTFVDLGSSAAIVAETPAEAARLFAEACDG